jgi:hypothetical protein
MRLLKPANNIQASSTYTTNDLVRDDVIPRYAILSHTWGADAEEVSFKDMIDGTGTSKPGYDKIRFCGEQAGHDDLQYFWIDTCCIDKSSSTELQEAIDSMFRWYRNAANATCILPTSRDLLMVSPVSRPGNHLFGRAGGSLGGGLFRSLLLQG